MSEYTVEMLSQLALSRCPHCNVAYPRIDRIYGPIDSVNYAGRNSRWWSFYRCYTCGGGILSASASQNGRVTEMYPSALIIDESIPDPAKNYLHQAIESLHAPAGCVMLTASSIDAMLKVKGLKEGTLNQRIDQASKDHLITTEMAAWAHEVRLDANDQRHADEVATLPDEEEAKKCISFALALAEFLFVLPAKVERGRKGQTV